MNDEPDATAEPTPSIEPKSTVWDAVRAELAGIVLGQERVIDQLLTCFIAGGHLLIEGVPGVAKTLLARSLAAALEARYSRVQFTPDLMPSDVTGVNIFQPETGSFLFRPGPIFSDIVLVDEINRAPAKTQAALLEAMQENQVTLDGKTHPLSSVFTVLATQNPIDYEGTYPLPEAQVDRFLMKIVVEYPSEDSEKEMLLRMHRLGIDGKRPDSRIRPVASVPALLEARNSIHDLEIDDSVLRYVVSIVRESRTFPSFTLGASPRAGLMLLNAAKALAVLRGRGFVSPDDVREIAPPVIRHRVLLTPEAQIEGLDADRCIQNLLQKVTVPR